MKKQLLLLILVACSALARAEDPGIAYHFESAARQYGIPVDVLKAVSYAETKFYHHVPEGATSHNGKPSVYGIMGLRNDSWFGYSLKIGASLINRTEQEVIDNVQYNIQAGAAYLAHIAAKHTEITADLNSWKRAVEEYSGIPQTDIKEFYSFDVFHGLKNGGDCNGVQLMAHPEINMAQFSERVNPANKLKNIESNDYPSAVWSASPNFTPGNIQQKFSVVHDTEGGFAGSLSWLQNPTAQASTHYIIRSSDGYIVQMVLEANKAWHVSCWNGYMLGVEHEGYVANPAFFTDAMYISSAALFRHFSTKFNIPFNRNRIIGHYEWQNSAWKTWMTANFPAIGLTCNTHTDPGPGWDWGFYMQLVSQDTAKPAVASYSPKAVTPADTFMLNTPIKITFTQKMKAANAQSAFSISPTVAGSFSWENNRTLVFKPYVPLATNTVYTVKLTNTAINYLNYTIADTLTFSFKTVQYNALNVVMTYPAANQSNVLKTVRAIAKFDFPLDQTTLAANIGLMDSMNSILALKSMRYIEENNQGIVYLTPKQKLEGNKDYSIIIKRNLKNSAGNAIGVDTKITFHTASTDYVTGTVIDELETVGSWKDPGYSGSTVGTDPNFTKFTISSEEFFSGANSGKITYLFTAADGVARTFNGAKPNVGSLPERKAGFWVNGDVSKNLLEYWFYYNNSTNVIVPVDTLNWSGWKLVEVPLSAVTGAGDKLLHSVVIRRASNGSASGAVYIDAMQTNDATGVAPAPAQLKPLSFTLEQNYPNPF
ncbi:MAG: Ig-like domain-containing protein [Ignavibacteriales bacterium]|nr:Ig-like domain-containing protein [Ignavibacteriales bacterium]